MPLRAAPEHARRLIPGGNKVSSYAQSAPSSHTGYSSLDGVSTVFIKKQPKNQKTQKTLGILLKSSGKAGFVAGRAGSPEPRSLLPGRAPAHPRGLRIPVSHPRGFHTLQTTAEKCFLQPWPGGSFLLRNTLARAGGCSRCARLGASPGPEMEIFKALQEYQR